MDFNFSSWLHRRKVATEFRQTARYVPAHRVVNPFHAVGVKPGQTCCQAALAIKGQRFLSAEAPKLPLKACDTACSCVYAHYDDRRSGSDRRMRASGTRHDRRRSGGRRATDP
jgi:hypothetical protein